MLPDPHQLCHRRLYEKKITHGPGETQASRRLLLPDLLILSFLFQPEGHNTRADVGRLFVCFFLASPLALPPSMTKGKKRATRGQIMLR